MERITFLVRCLNVLSSNALASTNRHVLTGQALRLFL